MGQEIISGALGEERILAASGGASLTTTANFTQFLKNTDYLVVTPRNFSVSGVLVKWTLNPYLVIIKTTNSMISGNTDYSEAAQDADTDTDVVLSSMDTLANGDFLLVGAHMPFRGVFCDVDGANDQTRTLTVSYRSFNAWVTVASLSDGTIDSSKTFAVDGIITWTVPSEALWKAATLKSIYPEIATGKLDAAAPYREIPLFWTRFEVDGALGTATTLNSMVAANRSTSYPEFLSGQTREMTVKTREVGAYGCIEHLTSTGTANLIILGSARRDGQVV